MAEETAVVETPQEVVTETPVEATPATEVQTPTETQEANPAVETPETTGPSRAQKRIQQLLEERDEWKAKAEEATAQTYTPPVKEKPAQVDADKSGHPALMGQKPDDDGQVYVNGEWVNAKDLIRDHDIAELRRLVEGDQQARKQAELDAREAAHDKEVGDAILDHIAEYREANLPNSEGEHAKWADRTAFKLVRDELTEAYAIAKSDPKAAAAFPAFAEKTIKEAFDDMRFGFAYYAQRQLESNAKAAETNKVKGPGTPGAPAEKSIQQMTAKELEAKSREWAAAAEKMSRGT